MQAGSPMTACHRCLEYGRQTLATLHGCPSIKAKVLSRTNYPSRCQGHRCCGQRVEDEDSGEHFLFESPISGPDSVAVLPFHQPSILPNCESSDARKTTTLAISSGCPMRSNGTCEASMLFRSRLWTIIGS